MSTTAAAVDVVMMANNAFDTDATAT